MQAKRIVRWGLSALCLVMGAVTVGCQSSKGTAGLESEHPLVRKAALERIARNPNMSDYDALVRTLRTDENRLVRSQAAFALGELNQRRFSIAFTPLVEALETDPSVFVRAAAATSLGDVRDARAVEILVTALDDQTRGEMVIKHGDKATLYKACPSDAARTSLEKVLRFKYTSDAMTAQERRDAISAQWQNWYAARRDRLPSARAYAKK